MNDTTAELVSPPNDVREIIDIAQEATTPHTLEPGKIYGVVAGGRVHTVDLDQDTYRDHPRRKTGTVRVHDADSFNLYYAKHAVDGVTEVYADTERRTVLAVLNAHQEGAVGEAGWSDHRLRLELRTTPEWQYWTKCDRAPLKQVDFAMHIEDGLDYIVSPEGSGSPTGAEMLEVAQRFQARTKVNFTAGNRLATGETQLVYTEETTASAGRGGEITIPERFTIALAPFEGAEKPWAVTARLRYKISRDAPLTLTYLLVEPHKVLRDAFLEQLAKIEDGLGVTVMHGSPA